SSPRGGTMRVRWLSPEELRPRPGAPPVDLRPYKDVLQSKQVGEGAEVELEEGESPQAVKRRFSTAAKELGLTLRWRRAGAGVVRFGIVEPPSEEQVQKRRESLVKARAAR